VSFSIGSLASLLLMAALAAPGIAALGRFTPWLTRLERWSYGAVAGIAVGTLAMVPAAALVGFTSSLVAAIGLASVIVAIVIWNGVHGIAGDRVDAIVEALRDPLPRVRAFAGGIDPVAAGVIGILVIRWAILWSSALVYQSDALWAGQKNIWSDWPYHLGIVSSFAFGDNFLPQNILFSGLPLSYHYLSDLTPAAFVLFGLDPAEALCLHSFVLSVIAALCIWAFARRLLRRPNVATLAMVLFLLGAGLGWITTVARFDATHDLLGTLTTAPWDQAGQDAMHIRFFNPYTAFLMSQRAYLYGLPLLMLSATILLRASRTRSTREFIAAGVIAGLLPLSHLPTLLAFAIVTPFLALLLSSPPWKLPWRGWIAFGVVWIVVSAPQLAIQLGGGAGALSSLRPVVGWVADPDPWWWFWVKNVGLYGILAIVGLVSARTLAPRPRRLLAAFMVVFVVANLMAFQPWDWDNHKILVYWFLAAAFISAAVVARAWRATRNVAIRGLLVFAVATMVASPVLESLDMLIGNGRYPMISTEQIEVAREVRDVTPPGSLLVTGMGHHDPIMMLSGRQLLMGYWGQLWVSGIPYEARQKDALEILTLGPGADALIKSYGVDFVVISTDDVREVGAAMDGYRARFPTVIETPNYAVFDVRGLDG